MSASSSRRVGAVGRRRLLARGYPARELPGQVGFHDRRSDVAARLTAGASPSASATCSIECLSAARISALDVPRLERSERNASIVPAHVRKSLAVISAPEASRR